MNSNHNAMLEEYKVLRNEITTRMKVQVEMLSFTVAALAALFGLAFAYSKYELFLVVPFFNIAIGFLYIYNKNRILEIGDYIKKEDILDVHISGSTTVRRKEVMKPRLSLSTYEIPDGFREKTEDFTNHVMFL